MTSFNWPPSAGGVSTYANFAALPATASDGDLAVTLDTDTLYVYNLATTTWLVLATGGAALSLGNLDAQAATAKGAALVSNVLSLQSADATHPGLVNNTTQTLSGAKTFTGVGSFPGGSVSAVGLHLSTDVGTGFYRPGVDQLNIAAAGSIVANIGTSGIAVTGLLSATTTITAGTAIFIGAADFSLRNLSTVFSVTNAAGNAFAPIGSSTYYVGNGANGQWSVSGLNLRSDQPVSWSSTTNATGTQDIGLIRHGAGYLRVTNGSSGMGSLVVAGIYYGVAGSSFPILIDGISAGGAIDMGSATIIRWSDTTDPVSYDVGIKRASSGVLYLSDGGAGNGTSFIVGNTTIGASRVTTTDVYVNASAVLQGIANVNSQRVLTSGFGNLSDAGFLASYYLLASGSGTSDVGISRSGAGILKITDGAAGSGGLSVSNIVGTGTLTLSALGAGVAVFNSSGVISSQSTTPTVQRFTSSTGTYTTPAGVRWIKVSMVGGGGGGGGSGSASTGAGGNGGDTTFGSSLLTAAKGIGAAAATGAAYGGAGGSPTINSPAIAIVSQIGGTGGGIVKGGVSITSASMPGGTGAYSFYGGAGGSGQNSAGLDASANSGSGGGGAGYDGTGASQYAGGGGGAGAYLSAIISAPSATYSYAVGAGGSAGSGGTSGSAGGTGAAGIIIVEEHYL